MMNSGIPVYKQLVDFYAKKILNQELAPESRMDSIVRIMNRHNVSRDTAKRVLKELSEKGYIRKIVGKGSFITSSTEVKNIWGMVIPFYSSNIEELIRNLKTEADYIGRELIYYLTYNNPEEEKKLVSEMVMNGFEAVIVIPNYNEELTADYYRHLIPGNTTIILVDHTMAGSYFKYVVQSYDLGVARAIEYLTAQNKGNLLLVKNEEWQGRNLLYELMERTFINSVQTKFPERKPFTTDSAGELTYEFLKSNGIGGILCCTDIDSVRVLGRIKNWGVKILEEISLVSYGNTELTEFFEPPITTLDCQYREMARKTAELISKGKNSGLLEQHIVNPRIIVRKT